LGLEHLEGSAAGIDLVVIGVIGELCEDAEQVLIPGASQDLLIAGAAVRTERLNRMSLSPLLGLGYR
jgi:hypothetical protein